MSVFDRFINGWRSSAVDFPIVSRANPVQWTRLAQAIVGSFVVGIIASMIEVWNGISTAYTGLIENARTFLTGGTVTVGEGDWQAYFRGEADPTLGFIDALIQPFVVISSEVWQFNVEQFGLLALPVTFGITLVSLYFVTVASRRAASVLLGGDLW